MLYGENLRRMELGIGIHDNAKTTSKDKGTMLRRKAKEQGEVISW
jgi:hypothetical protein